MTPKKQHQLKPYYRVEKVQRFGIRKLKVGVASLVVATGLFLSASPIQAQETGQSLETNASQPDPLTSESTDSPSAQEPAANDQVTTSQAVAPETAAETTNDQPSLAQARVATTTSLTSPEPIAENHIRMHFESLPSLPVEDLGVWHWGGVEAPSENWPSGATLFSEARQDDYGYFVDIAKAQTPGDIGFLLLNTKGTDDATIKLTPQDQTVDLIDPSMNEVWFDADLKQHNYQPLADDGTIRINYLRQDGNYDNLGVWLWGDVAQASSDWPAGALSFDGQGQYGAYVDVPLSKGLDSQIGFLILDKTTGDKKVEDVNFANRQTHSQIFLREDEEKAYTNPYFVDESVLNPATATPGSANVQVTGQVDRVLQAGRYGLLDIAIANPDNIEIALIQADTSQLGTSSELVISPELNRATVTVTDQVAPGKYQIPVRVYDQNNQYYESLVEVTVEAADQVDPRKAWDQQVIYFMLTDRFNDGDPSNNNPYGMPYDQAQNQGGVYKGGDFKGVTEKLDYLADLGVTAIWLSPIVENIKFDVSDGTSGEFYGYHGYWASDFEQLNPHLGSLADFHELIDQAAERGINIMVDVVLNHPGYGMNPGDTGTASGYPTAQDQSKFEGLIRQEDGSNPDTQRSLSGLPDFETERHEVRQRLVDWQASWLERATTAKGNSIYGFRVDTVKNVDNTTWQHFKNVLVERNDQFHLIGESWGASHTNDNDHLGEGKMDSLLDFGFKEIARSFVMGRLTQANDQLIERNQFLSSANTLGQFLSSHDEDGFLYTLKDDLAKYNIATTLQLTAKGQPVIYYGEELAYSGANNWPVYDNRYAIDWTKTQDNPTLDHYSRLLDFRSDYSQLLSKGDRTTFAGNNSEGWLMAKRTYQDESAFITTNISDTAKSLRLSLSAADTLVTDHYSGKTYAAQVDSQGNYYAIVEAPPASEGGTLLLTASQGQIVNARQDLVAEDPIAQGDLRIHFKSLPEGDPSSLGLWTWGQVKTPSESLGSWPNGATSFADAKTDDYGYYLDVTKANDQATSISYLINNSKGDNITGDQQINLISPQVNEVWLDSDFKVFYYPPLAEDLTVRVNYLREDGNYQDLSLWTFLSAVDRQADWPDGVDLDKVGSYGAYADIALKDLNELGLVLVNQVTGQKVIDADLKFGDLEKHSQIFIRENDPKVYTNPYFISETLATGAEMVSPSEIIVTFNSLEGLSPEEVKANISLVDKEGQVIAIDPQSMTVDVDSGRVSLKGDFPANLDPYQVTYESTQLAVRKGWRYTDALYAYEGPLGARVLENGAKADVNLWSPSAQAVSIVVFDKTQTDQVLASLPMQVNESGVWHLVVDAKEDLKLADLTNYLYQFEIIRDGQKFWVLDPYAKSLGMWNSDQPPVMAEDVVSKPVAKAAFVNPAALGPSDLDFAQIEGYDKREDAIIYEVHVRDFTSDPSIADDLKAQFGTFAAFVEKLDYIQDLGVTHIQLLPVMSYYHANESLNDQRLLDYASSGVNYNWGYDPQSYFALTGMYSENPSDPSLRIAEFKNLVNEIHKRGMGVILDVVYNHTASLHILEDLEPHYYHFMEADGTPKESFGGGRLGTTHAMSRRILVDSIKYLVDEYKVDGFRFDMMGDHDAAAIQAAYDAAAAINPKIFMLGEGWVTFTGDAGDPVQAADQQWMKDTDSVASFSDEIRNELKSGFGSEGLPRFLTGGPRNIQTIYDNILGRPGNFVADDPGDVIQYIAAHDNLTLHDVIAQSIKKDPSHHSAEILRRVRLGNAMILTSQGTPFIHAGQEFGRTKQFLHQAYQGPVADALVPNKATFMTDADGTPFDYPYFIHDSYDSTDAINKIDWQKALDSEMYPENTKTRAYTKGLIAIRRSTDAFSRGTKEEIDSNVSLLTLPGQNGVQAEDLIIAYQAIDSKGDKYLVFINADDKARHFTLDRLLAAAAKAGDTLADANQAGIEAIADPHGVQFEEDGLTLEGLTSIIIRIKADQIVTENPVVVPPKDTGQDPGLGQVKPVTPPVIGPDLEQEPVDQADGDQSTGSNQQLDQGDKDGIEGFVDPGLALESDRQTASLLPATGETDQYLLFSGAALSILLGLGLVAHQGKKEKD
ncbi:TPA: pullulanase [Streptococcus suis]